MKKIAYILWLMFLSLDMLQARDVYNLNKNWKFSNTALRSNVPQEVSLPHTWNARPLGVDEGVTYAIGHYLKEIKIPKEWGNKKRIFIRFNGVSNIANLFVNGKYVGEHRGGYTAFTFEITPFLRFDNYNSILMVVSNAPQMDVMPVQGDLNSYGGIYRDVELIVTDQNHISLSDYGSDGVYIRQRKLEADEAEISVVVKLNGFPAVDMQVGVRVLNGAEEVVSASGTGKIMADGTGVVNIPVTIPSPRRWNGVKDPFMYQLEVQTFDGKESKDLLTIPFGLRTFSIDREKGFILNGQPYKIYGVNKHQDRGGSGNALTRQDHEEDIRIITDMGATAVRMAFAPQDRYVYDLCDRNGLIVWSDLPFVSDNMFGGKGFVDSYLFKDNGERQLREMIRQHYNHPSVVFWGIFSDVTTNGDSPITYIRSLNTTAHTESPDRLTACSSIEDGPINFITDVVGWSQYFGWEKGEVGDMQIWMNQFKSEWLDLYPALSAYGAGANVKHQAESKDRPSAEGSYHPESYQAFLHENYLKAISQTPYFWGTFVNAIFDYGSENRRSGGMDGVSDMGLVTYDRHLKKDAYYLYKANWNDIDPFVYITDRRNNQRNGVKQSVKVYTNIDEEVQLFVNGELVGAAVPQNGIVEWTDLTFKSGVNTIVAISGRYHDTVEVEIFGSLLAQ